jgi:hypothetical protein
LKVSVEVATYCQRNEHDSERNRNLHGVVQHGVAHDQPPFHRKHQQIEWRSALIWIKGRVSQRLCCRGGKPLRGDAGSCWPYEQQRAVHFTDNDGHCLLTSSIALHSFRAVCFIEALVFLMVNGDHTPVTINGCVPPQL